MSVRWQMSVVTQPADVRRRKRRQTPVAMQKKPNHGNSLEHQTARVIEEVEIGMTKKTREKVALTSGRQRLMGGCWRQQSTRTMRTLGFILGGSIVKAHCADGEHSAADFRVKGY